MASTPTHDFGRDRRPHSGRALAGTAAAALRHLAKWRALMLDQTWKRQATKVLGPFRGMDYPVRAAEGNPRSAASGRL
jgi:hypothetical protein